jgi:hypothetical protein
MHHLQKLLPREVTLAENKIIFDDENGTPSGVMPSFQVGSSPPVIL